ncbi:hypothetical protein AB3U99_20750 [Niallia sp. JL1B1071]|uniref:hypothetical protein n=1 Tax=Niallia tiangongensis TaxID=3237105 RepID=UPI0037DDDED0
MEANIHAFFTISNSKCSLYLNGESKYIKEIKGLLPQVEVIPIGGITEGNAPDFLKAGSFALGIGSTLVNDKLIQDLNFAEIERRAKQLVNGGH